MLEALRSAEEEEEEEDGDEEDGSGRTGPAWEEGFSTAGAG